jgi:hypothetical protein
VAQTPVSKGGGVLPPFYSIVLEKTRGRSFLPAVRISIPKGLFKRVKPKKTDAGDFSEKTSKPKISDDFNAYGYYQAVFCRRGYEET